MARELLAVVEQNDLAGIDVTCLPASYHNTPSMIPDAVEARIVANRDAYDEMFVAYGDCGTGGMLDRILERHGIDRLAGAHCYEFLAGAGLFASLHEADPATFYLTDFLVRHFDRLVWKGLWLDRYPQLRDDYFGNYHRVVYLSQIEDPDMLQRARRAATQLGLDFEHRRVGYGELQPALVSIGRS